MKPLDLHSLWTAPDNSRLTAKQVSMRFPVHVAAKLSALCDLYPKKTRTQIVGDLLAQALEIMESTMPADPVIGEFVFDAQDPEIGYIKCHRDLSVLARYKTAANMHFRQLELELGNDSPAELFSTDHQNGDERFFGVTVHTEDRGN